MLRTIVMSCAVLACAAARSAIPPDVVQALAGRLPAAVSPLVAAEAVALGRKVVAFAVGGLPEACQGLAELVPAGDVKALAAKIDSVIA